MLSTRSSDSIGLGTALAPPIGVAERAKVAAAPRVNLALTAQRQAVQPAGGDAHNAPVSCIDGTGMGGPMKRGFSGSAPGSIACPKLSSSELSVPQVSRWPYSASTKRLKPSPAASGASRLIASQKARFRRYDTHDRAHLRRQEQMRRPRVVARRRPMDRSRSAAAEE